MALRITSGTTSMTTPASMTSPILPGPIAPLPSAPPTSTSTPPSVTAGAPADITTTPYPPMTTHWSRPLSCTWTYVVDYELPPSTDGPVAWLDLEPIPGATSLSCYPDGMFRNTKTTGVFSPATCPNGWTTVSISVNTDQPPDEATTTALCCSSEYTLDGKHCKRQVPTALAVPITYNHTASTYEVFTNSTTTLYSATLAVHTIRALFRAADQSLLGITDDSDIDDDPEPWHLTIAAKIGIGVGVTIFGLLSIAALVFLFFRARQKGRDRLKGRSHEMSSMRGSGAGGRPFPEMGWSASPPRNNAHGHHAVQHVAAVRGTDMAHDSDGAADEHSLGDSESENTAAQEEIRVLMAQKAAIQRRIEELERSGNEHETQTPNQEK